MMLRRFEDASAGFLLVWGMAPADLSAGRADQTAAVLLDMERMLAGCGMSFADVVRTWFYLDDIASWYPEFNAARTRFFESRRVFETFLPASTGIGHPNPFGAALTAGFFAMRPKNGGARAVTLKSLLQRDPMSYRSSFSRAAETASASGRRLFVSGTASLLPDSSEVAFPGDPARQIDCAMCAALAILESRGMTTANVTRAVAYVKRPEHRPLWFDWLERRGLPRSFASVMTADVCRPDWLFEIELDAACPT